MRNSSLESHFSFGWAIAATMIALGFNYPTAFATAFLLGLSVEVLQFFYPALGAFQEKDIAYTALGAFVALLFLHLLSP